MARHPSAGSSARETHRLRWLIHTHRALTVGVLLGILLLVWVLQLYQGSRTALIGRNAQLLEGEAEELRRANALLEQRIANGQSLDYIQARANTLGQSYQRPEPDEVEYLVVAVPAPSATPAPSPTPLPVPPDSMGEALWLALRNQFDDLVIGVSDGP